MFAPEINCNYVLTGRFYTAEDLTNTYEILCMRYSKRTKHYNGRRTVSVCLAGDTFARILGPEVHPASYAMGTGLFSGPRGRGVALNTHLHLALRLKKE
jgi:hypothetical protein